MERLHNTAVLIVMCLQVLRTKTHFGKSSVARSFQSGDCVLALLPVAGSVLYARFLGPYVIH